MGELTGAIRELVGRIDETRSKASAEDSGRVVAAEAGIAEKTAEILAAKEQQAAEEKKRIDEAVKAALADLRVPSKAGLIGQGQAADPVNRMIAGGNGGTPHPALKASIRDYQAGELLTALLDIHAIETGGIDFEAVQRGKAKLADLGALWWGMPEASKATLGATGATGGYVLPNNLVDTLVKPETQAAVYQLLVTVRTGVNVRGVDQPYRTGAPARMVFQDWGTTKENVNEAYGSYTATLGTLARIYDIGKQYARFSAGAAEADVIDELGKAAILGENYYMLAGAGTGSVGTGDPTVGIYTALANGFGGAYTTTGVPVAGTIAGSAAAQLLTAFGALASRSRTPSAVVMDAATYYSLFAQGSDTAGFFMSELLGAGFQVGGDFSLRFRGIPIYYDANFNTNTSTTKRAIAADWKVFKLYRGMEFRIDTSDVAGDRWDKNLIGFRGEEEIGWNAYTGCAVGAAQLITGVIP
jgi:HK97 family phage major capsid protein